MRDVNFPFSDISKFKIETAMSVGNLINNVIVGFEYFVK